VCKCVLYYCHRLSTQLQLTNISIDCSLSCKYSKFSFEWELFFKCYLKKFQLSKHHSKRQNLYKFESAAPSDFCPSGNVEVLPVVYYHEHPVTVFLISTFRSTAHSGCCERASQGGDHPNNISSLTFATLTHLGSTFNLR
jgi:hypothetical protein